MTDLEFQIAQDIARIENALGALAALETTEVPTVSSQLKETRQNLRRSLTIREPRADAGKSRVRKGDDAAALLDFNNARAK